MVALLRLRINDSENQSLILKSEFDHKNSSRIKLFYPVLIQRKVRTVLTLKLFLLVGLLISCIFRG